MIADSFYLMISTAIPSIKAGAHDLEPLSVLTSWVKPFVSLFYF